MDGSAGVGREQVGTAKLSLAPEALAALSITRSRSAPIHSDSGEAAAVAAQAPPTRQPVPLKAEGQSGARSAVPAEVARALRSLPNAAAIGALHRKDPGASVRSVLDATCAAIGDRCDDWQEAVSCVNVLSWARPPIAPNGRVWSAAIARCGREPQASQAAADALYERACASEAVADIGVHNTYFKVCGRAERTDRLWQAWGNLLRLGDTQGVRPDNDSYRYVMRGLDAARAYACVLEVWDHLADKGKAHGVYPCKGTRMLALTAARATGRSTGEVHTVWAGPNAGKRRLEATRSAVRDPDQPQPMRRRLTESSWSPVDSEGPWSMSPTSSMSQGSSFFAPIVPQPASVPVLHPVPFESMPAMPHPGLPVGGAQWLAHPVAATVHPARANFDQLIGRVRQLSVEGRAGTRDYHEAFMALAAGLNELSKAGLARDHDYCGVMLACERGPQQCALEAGGLFSRYRREVKGFRFYELYITACGKVGLIEEVNRAWDDLLKVRDEKPDLFPNDMTYHAYLLAQLNHYATFKDQADDEPLKRATAAWKDLVQNGPARGVVPNTAVYKRMLELCRKAEMPQGVRQVWKHMVSRTPPDGGAPPHPALADVGIYKTLMPVVGTGRLDDIAVEVSRMLRRYTPGPAAEKRMLGPCNVLLCTFTRAGRLDEARTMYQHIGPAANARTHEAWLWELAQAVASGGAPPALVAEALYAWQKLLQAGANGVHPTAMTYTSLLAICRRADLSTHSNQVLTHWTAHMPQGPAAVGEYCLSMLDFLLYEEPATLQEAHVLAGQALRVYEAMVDRAVPPTTLVCNRVLVMAGRAGLVNEAIDKFEGFLRGRLGPGAQPTEVSYATLFSACPDNDQGRAAMSRLLNMGIEAKVFAPGLGHDANKHTLDLRPGALMFDAVAQGISSTAQPLASTSRAVFHEVVRRGVIGPHNIARTRVITGVDSGLVPATVIQCAAAYGWTLVPAGTGSAGAPDAGTLVFRQRTIASTLVEQAAKRAEPAFEAFPPTDPALGAQALQALVRRAVRPDGPLRDDPTTRQVVTNARGGKWLFDVATTMTNQGRGKADLLLSDGARMVHAVLEALPDGGSRSYRYRITEFGPDFRPAKTTHAKDGKELKAFALTHCFTQLAVRSSFVVAMSPDIGLWAPGNLGYRDDKVLNPAPKHWVQYRQAMGACLQYNMVAAFRRMCREVREEGMRPDDVLSFMRFIDAGSPPLLARLKDNDLTDPGILQVYADELAEMVPGHQKLAATLKELGLQPSSSSSVRR